MSTRGRKADLKAIDGGLSGVPKPPATLPADMVAEWTVIATDMVARKILTAPALGVLETYIVARWMVQECQKSLHEHSPLVKTAHGMLKPNPAAGMLSKAMETVARLSAELGLTPAARSKQGFTPKDKPKGGAPDGLEV
jgi:P27 family predicted phage terminase small subunit